MQLLRPSLFFSVKRFSTEFRPHSSPKPIGELDCQNERPTINAKKCKIRQELSKYELGTYVRVRHIFLDFKVSRYIEGYSFLSIRGP